MIALLGALKEEVGFLRRHMRLPRVASPDAPCHVYPGVYHGRDVLLVQTGMGRQHAQAATRLVLDRYPIELVISFGFAGGLRDDLDAGDVVVCRRLRCDDEDVNNGGTVVYETSCDRFPMAMDALERSPLRVRFEDCVTTTDLVTNPAVKRALAERFHAAIADMESAWIAPLAAERQVPMVVLRAISDRRTDAMPPFLQMMTLDGRWKPRQTAAYFLRHPLRIAGLLPLYRNVRRAGTRLARAIDVLIDAM